MATMAATDYQMPIGGEWGESKAGASRSRTRRTARSSAPCRNGNRRRRASARSMPPRRRWQGWRSTPRIERARILRRSADLIRERGTSSAP